MRYLLLFFLGLSIGKLHAQTPMAYHGHVICGLWNVGATDWQYFFYETGAGFMMHKDSATSEEHFTYRIDTSGVLDQITIQFDDSLLRPVCFLVEKNDAHTITIYHLVDNQNCPQSPTQEKVQSVIWRRSLDGN